jgi:hypothetical protein
MERLEQKWSGELTEFLQRHRDESRSQKQDEAQQGHTGGWLVAAADARRYPSEEDTKAEYPGWAIGQEK